MQQVWAVQSPALVEPIQEPDLSSLYFSIRLSLEDPMFHLLGNLKAARLWMGFLICAPWIVKTTRYLAKKLVGLLQIFGDRLVLRQNKLHPFSQE